MVPETRVLRAADGEDLVILAWRFVYYWQPIGSRQCPIRWYGRRPPTTYHLSTISHGKHTIVHYDLSRSSKVN